MKIVRRIALFLTVSVVMFVAGGYGAIKAEQFFYPNRYPLRTESKPVQEYSAPLQQTQTGTLKEQAAGNYEEEVIEAAVEDKPVITADTLYLVEKVNLTEGTIDEAKERIPVKYIGLDREEMIEEMDAYEKNPPLTELEQGFESIELTAFSKDRVVVCKYYKSEKKGFYLMVSDHFVVVYEEDRETLHSNTDILLESLDEELQAQIMQGKYMESEEELYAFLEAHSS